MAGLSVGLVMSLGVAGMGWRFFMLRLGRAFTLSPLLGIRVFLRLRGILLGIGWLILRPMMGRGVVRLGD